MGYMDLGYEMDPEAYEEARRIMLLVPVYPEEVTVKKIARSTWRYSAEIRLLIDRLPADMPLAERKEGRTTYLTFPSIEAKRRAVGEKYAV